MTKIENQIIKAIKRAAEFLVSLLKKIEKGEEI